MVEQFKERNKQTAQKSKGLRKQLLSQPIMDKEKGYESNK
jgi:hypothetical protein